MSSRRFRRLELDAARGSDASSDGPTDVCRRCGAEHAEGVPTCARCGGVLGGAGQDAFDAAHRARRELLEREAVRDRVFVPPKNGPASAEPRADEVPARPSRRSAGPEPGFASLLVAGVLTACIFALVSIPVRLAFSAAAREGAPWKAFLEIGIVAVITILVKRAAGRTLSGF